MGAWGWWLVLEVGGWCLRLVVGAWGWWLVLEVGGQANFLKPQERDYTKDHPVIEPNSTPPNPFNKTWVTSGRNKTKKCLAIFNHCLFLWAKGNGLPKATSKYYFTRDVNFSEFLLVPLATWKFSYSLEWAKRKLAWNICDFFGLYYSDSSKKCLISPRDSKKKSLTSLALHQPNHLYQFPVLFNPRVVPGRPIDLHHFTWRWR